MERNAAIFRAWRYLDQKSGHRLNKTALPVISGLGLLISACARPPELTGYSGNVPANLTPTPEPKPEFVLPPDALPNRVAEEFLRATMRRDLATARTFFAPDREVTFWKDIFIWDSQLAQSTIRQARQHGYTGGDDDPVADFSRCIRENYTLVERSVSQYKTVSVRFSEPCISFWEAVTRFNEFSIEERHYQNFNISLELANNQWFITPYFLNGRDMVSTGIVK